MLHHRVHRTIGVIRVDDELPPVAVRRRRISHAQQHVLGAPNDIAAQRRDVLVAAQHHPAHSHSGHAADVGSVQVVGMNGHQSRMDTDRDRRIQLRAQCGHRSPAGVRASSAQRRHRAERTPGTTPQRARTSRGSRSADVSPGDRTAEVDVPERMTDRCSTVSPEPSSPAPWPPAKGDLSHNRPAQNRSQEYLRSLDGARPNPDEALTALWAT